MENKNLKSSLSEYLKEQPTGSFSKNIMHKIKEEAFLKMYLKPGLAQKAPANFTVKVLDACLPKSAITNYKPVISKKIWSLISVAFVLIIFFSFRDSKTGVTSKYIDIATGIFSSKLNLILQLFISNNFLMILIISVSALILLDTVLNTGRSIFKKV